MGVQMISTICFAVAVHNARALDNCQIAYQNAGYTLKSNLSSINCNAANTDGNCYSCCDLASDLCVSERSDCGSGKWRDSTKNLIVVNRTIEGEYEEKCCTAQNSSKCDGTCRREGMKAKTGFADIVCLEDCDDDECCGADGTDCNALYRAGSTCSVGGAPKYSAAYAAATNATFETTCCARGTVKCTTASCQPGKFLKSTHATIVCGTAENCANADLADDLCCERKEGRLSCSTQYMDKCDDTTKYKSYSGAIEVTKNESDSSAIDHEEKCCTEPLLTCALFGAATITTTTTTTASIEEPTSSAEKQKMLASAVIMIVGVFVLCGNWN